jgi:peptide/nickel transport system substrate-binding protein
MKRELGYLLCTVILVTSGTAWPFVCYASAAPVSGAFSFQHESSYVDENKIYHILGEIRNLSSQPIGSIVITASFKDKDGHVIGNSSSAPSIHTLNPGETSGFEMLLLNSTNSNLINSYDLSASAQPTQAESYALTIVSSNSRLDLLGTYYINALVRNNAVQNATNALLVASLYDKDGNVIAIGKALAEAVPGTAEIPAGEQAAFGVAITDKLQTYKTAWYTLVVESDQFVSNKVLLTPANSTYNTISLGTQINNPKSGCLIATAAFGSPLAPEVQQLRIFIDNIVMSTISGSDFMQAFNAWYYSFSPTFADFERQHPFLQSLVRLGILPLLAILQSSTNIQLTLPTNPEVAIIATGLFASAMLGVIYLGPVALIISAVMRNRQLRMKFALLVNALVFSIGLCITFLSVVLGVTYLGWIGTSLLVLASIAGSVLLVIWVSRLKTVQLILRPKFSRQLT